MPRRTLIAIAGCLLVLAACGSSAGASQPAATSGTGGTTPTAAATDQGGGATTPAPAATDQPGATTSGGGNVGDACKLLTNDEAAAATGMTNVTSGPIPAENLTDAISGCAWVSGGTIPVVNCIYLASGVNTDPNTLKILPESVEVSVNGARAIWAPAAGQVLFVFKSDKVVMIQVLMPLNNDIQSTATALAQKVADRM